LCSRLLLPWLDRRVEGGPHNIGWTHPDEVNRALLEFLAA
jgi:hypothetical protein